MFKYLLDKISEFSCESSTLVVLFTFGVGIILLIFLLRGLFIIISDKYFMRQ